MTKKQKSPGRPRIGGGESIQLAIRFPAAMIDAIDAIVEARLDRPDRAALIRELIAEALAARKGRK